MTGRSGAGAISDHQCLLFYAQFFSIPYRLPPTGTNQLLHSILLYSILLYSALLILFWLQQTSLSEHHHISTTMVTTGPWRRSKEQVRPEERTGRCFVASRGPGCSQLIFGVEATGKKPYL